jgi:uncharacterized C2H2 Zn-finger protein
MISGYLKDINPVAYEELEDFWYEDSRDKTIEKALIRNTDTLLIGKWYCSHCHMYWFSNINYRGMLEKDTSCIFCKYNNAASNIKIIKQNIDRSCDRSHDKIVTYVYSKATNILTKFIGKIDEIGYMILDEDQDITSIFERYPKLQYEWSNKNLWAIDKVWPLGDCDYPFWWVCSKCHEEYELSLQRKLRNGDRACPFCSGYKVSKENSLMQKYPKLASKWSDWMNEKKACEIGLNDISVYFECPNCGVVYQNSVKDELNRQECVYCNEGMTKDILNTICKEYAGPVTEKGFLNPKGKSLVDWICNDCGSKYPATMHDRFHLKKSCTYCAGKHAMPRKVKLLSNEQPDLKKEWIYEVNILIGLNFEKILSSASKKAWWRCSKCGQIYMQSPAKRIIFDKRKIEPCPHCKGYHRNQHHFF